MILTLHFLQFAAMLYPCPATPTVPLGKVDKPASVLQSVPAKFPEEARKARVLPTKAALSMTVDEKGKPCDIEILSPEGMGFEREAVAAVLKWKFKPAVSNGIPVRSQVSIEAYFQDFDTFWQVDQKLDRRFQEAIRSGGSAALETLLELDSQKFPPAQAYVAFLRYRGERLALDQQKAFETLKKLNLNYAPYGHYALGMIYEEGKVTPKDEEAAMKHFIEGARVGVLAAQIQLANAYLKKGDRQLAVRYFKLCGISHEACNAKAKQLTSESYPGKTPQ
jgi:TonB family protein